MNSWRGRVKSGRRALAGLALAATCCALGCGGVSANRKAAMEASPQYSEGKFVNTLPAAPIPFWKTLGAWMAGAPHTQPEEAPPITPVSRKDFQAAPKSGLRITWMGHSSSVVELDGATLLLDPVWSKRTSPVSFAGPTRFHEPPIALDQLPDIDAVVLSHDHYDHLDKGTITGLEGLKNEKGGPKVGLYVVPLGVGQHLEDWGVPPERIVDLDWWESKKIGEVELVATPARHFSGRSMMFTDADHTLWASWSLIGPQHRVFFSGDSALTPQFAEIGEKYGPFDAALVETGAYNQLWSDVHMGPEQAVECHQMVRGGLYIPVHWGTYDLALHGWTEPVERVIVAAHKAGITLAVPRAGEMIEPADPPALKRYWPNVPWESALDAPVRSTGLDD